MLPSDPEDYFDPPQEARLQLAFARTNLPGLCLILVGTINLILASVFLVKGFPLLEEDPKGLLRELRRNLKSDALDKISPEEARELLVNTLILCGANVLFSLLTITSGMFMRTLRNYRLTLTGAILSAIPGLSLLSCLLVGIAVGVWAVIVLLRPEVRSAFV